MDKRRGGYARPPAASHPHHHRVNWGTLPLREPLERFRSGTGVAGRVLSGVRRSSLAMRRWDNWNRAYVGNGSGSGPHPLGDESGVADILPVNVAYHGNTGKPAYGYRHWCRSVSFVATGFPYKRSSDTTDYGQHSLDGLGCERKTVSETSKQHKYASYIQAIRSKETASGIGLDTCLALDTRSKRARRNTCERRTSTKASLHEIIMSEVRSRLSCWHLCLLS